MLEERFPCLIPAGAHPALVESVQREMGGYLCKTHLPLWSPPADRHHEVAIVDLSFTPDGKLIRSLGWGGELRLWDVATGDSAGCIEVDYPGGERIEAISPDGRMVAIVNDYDDEAEDAAFLWDLVGRRSIAGPIRAGESIRDIEFSPDSKLMALVGDSADVVLWDIESGRHIEIGSGDRYFIEELASVMFSPDGRYLMSADVDGNHVLWEASTWTRVGQIFLKTRGPVAFSPDGSCLATIDGERTVRLVRLPSAIPIGTAMEGLTSDLTSLRFSPEGKVLAAGSSDGTICLWDPVTGERLGEPLEGHPDAVRSLAFSADGSTLVSGSQVICVWDVASRERVRGPVFDVSGRSESPWSVSANTSFSPDGRSLASWGQEQTLRLWDTATGALVGVPFRGRSQRILGVAFCPDGKLLAVASGDEGVGLWDGRAGTPIGGPVQGSVGNHPQVVFSDDRRVVAFTTDERTVCLMTTATGDVIGRSLGGHLEAVAAMAFSPGGKILAASARAIHLWDAVTGEALREPITGFGGGALAFSPDGDVLLSGTTVLRQWDVATWELVGDYVRGRAGTVSRLRFSPDGGTLLVGGQSGVEFWNLIGNTLGDPALVIFSATLAGAGFSPDGKILALGVGNAIEFVGASEGTPRSPPILRRVSRGLGGAVFSPDGKMVAGVVDSNTLHLWDAGTMSSEPMGHGVDLAAYVDQGWYALGGDGLVFTAPRLDHLSKEKVYPMVNLPP